jgi:hypothetical protein
MYLAEYNYFDIPIDTAFDSFMTSKEESDLQLVLKLRKKGLITTPSSLFKVSQKREIDSLIARGVFHFKEYNPVKYQGIRIFNSRIINEIKSKVTNTLYKKSRLVIQAYNNNKKEMILTQSLIIQRASQKIIIILVPLVIQLKKNINLWFRDIT